MREQEAVVGGDTCGFCAGSSSSERRMLLRRNLRNKKRGKQLFFVRRKVVFFLEIAPMQVCGRYFLNRRQHGCIMQFACKNASSTRAQGSGDRAGCGSRRPMSEETRAAAAWRTSSSERKKASTKKPSKQ